MILAPSAAAISAEHFAAVAQARLRGEAASADGSAPDDGALLGRAYRLLARDEARLAAAQQLDAAAQARRRASTVGEIKAVGKGVHAPALAPPPAPPPRLPHLF